MDDATPIGTLRNLGPKSAAWLCESGVETVGDPMPTGGKRLAYADAALNAVVVIDGTTVWAYRSKAA